MPKNTSKEGVVCIKNDNGDLVAIIYKDMSSRKNIFYSCTEMSLEQLEEFVKSDLVNAKI